MRRVFSPRLTTGATRPSPNSALPGSSTSIVSTTPRFAARYAPQGARASVRVESVNTLKPFAQNYPVFADGSFHAILNPGDYRVVISGTGIRTRTRVVHVDDSRLSLKLALGE